MIWVLASRTTASSRNPPALGVERPGKGLRRPLANVRRGGPGELYRLSGFPSRGWGNRLRVCPFPTPPARLAFSAGSPSLEDAVAPCTHPFLPILTSPTLCRTEGGRGGVRAILGPERHLHRGPRPGPRSALGWREGERRERGMTAPRPPTPHPPPPAPLRLGWRRSQPTRTQESRNSC